MSQFEQHSKVIEIAEVYGDFVAPQSGDVVDYEYLIDGAIIAGSVIAAGYQGAGKTSNIVPLTCKMAWLCHDDDPLKPLLRRHIIYIAEDAKQVQMILASMMTADEFPSGMTMDEVYEWFHILEAKRMPTSEIVKSAGRFLRLTHTNVNPINGATYEAKPLVVFDTANANMALENESDNSEVGKAVAILKQDFDHIPHIIVTHIGKALRRAEVGDLSSRGASAWEADTQQTIYIVPDGDDGSDLRWLEIKALKHRFVTDLDGIQFSLVLSKIDGLDVLGNHKVMTVAHGRPTPILAGKRRELVEAMLTEKEKAKKAQIRGDLLALTREAAVNKTYMSKTDFISQVKGAKNAEKLAEFNDLILEGWIAVIDIPPHIRANNKRDQFFYGLTAPQHQRFKESGVIPFTVDDAPKAAIKEMDLGINGTEKGKK
jgi:AAA domain